MKILLTIMFAVALTGNLAAADVSINDLAAPSAPAFTLFGVAPSSIDLPSNPKALAVDVADAAATGSIPQDYALEFTPYWMVDHPYNTISNPANGWYESALESMNISVATVSLSGTAIPEGVTGTALGMGFSTTLVNGRPLQAAVDLLNNRDTAVAGLQAKLFDIPPGVTGTALAAYKDQIFAQIQSTVTATAAALSKVQTRTGLIVQLSGGVGIDFPYGDPDSGSLRQDGSWLTVDYRTDTLIDSIVLVRYLRDELDSNADAADLGAKFLWQKNDFGISTEYLARRYEFSDTWRLDGQAQYRLNDSTYITATFGRDFASEGSSTGALISLLGLKFAVSPTAVLEQN